MEFVVSNLSVANGRSPAKIIVLFGRTAIVHLNYATSSPAFSTKTGYDVKRS